MKLRLRISFLFLFILAVSLSLFAQPEKKQIFVKPELVKSLSEPEIRLLDSVFQITLSVEAQFPMISSVFSEKDSLWVSIMNQNQHIDQFAIAPIREQTVPYFWVIATGGTLTLLVLLYFIRF